MAYDQNSINAVALERVNETMLRMDERWHDAIKEMRQDFKNSQEKTDAKFEKINDTLAKLVTVDIENKEIKESLGRAFRRIEMVEHHQTSDGCPAHKSFLAVRAEQIKAFESLADECEEKHEAMNKRLETLEQKPLKAMDKIWMALLGALGTGVGGYILLKIGVSK